MPDQDDFYGGASGATSMSWNDKHAPGCYVNQWRGGLVLGTRKFQSTNMKTGKPDFWPDGHGGFSDRPIITLAVTVLSEEKDPANPTDDGARTIYIQQEGLKYSKNNRRFAGQVKPGVKFGAHCDAMVAGGHPRELPAPGGLYYLMQTGDVEGDGDIRRKTWTASYTAPTQQTLAALDAHVGKSNTGDSMHDQQPTAASPFGPTPRAPEPSAPAEAYQQYERETQRPAANQAPSAPQYQPAAQQAPPNPYQSGPPAQQPQQAGPTAPPNPYAR